MFKLVVLSALVAVALAAPKPGFVAPVTAYSSVVGSVPTSISSSSSSVVHGHAVHTSPIVADVPVAVGYTAPAVHTYAAAVPAVRTYSTHGLVNTYGAHIGAPLVYGGYGVNGIYGLNGVNGIYGVNGVQVY